MAIVYKITNKVNGKLYIGATEKTLEARWKDHVRCAIKKNKNWLLSRAIRKYGPEAFIIEVLEEHPDRRYAFDVLEPKYILEHNTFGDNGYNMTGGSEGGIGHKHTEETKRKIGLSCKKSLGDSVVRQKISDGIRTSYKNGHRKIPKKRQPVSDETKKKISNSLKTNRALNSTLGISGWTHSDEAKEKMRNAALNRTPEIKAKIARSRIGRECTPETREKLRQANLGKNKK